MRDAPGAPNRKHSMPKKTQKRNSRNAAARSSLARGSTFIRWADWDPTYTGNNRLSVYDTKEGQRGNRPDLAPIKVRVTVL
jgi:hypothetical protein